ncbi:hypothetical protein J6590_044525 [Homalodisca vitripennis]|nr:hypothetical protein J6590_044525 [Homalodisca vitripennis]
MDSKLKCVFEMPVEENTVSATSQETSNAVEDKTKRVGDSPSVAHDGDLVKAAKEVKHLREEESSLRQENLQLKNLRLLQKPIRFEGSCSLMSLWLRRYASRNLFRILIWQDILAKHAPLIPPCLLRHPVIVMCFFNRRGILKVSTAMMTIGLNNHVAAVLFCKSKCALTRGRDVHEYETRGRDNYRVRFINSLPDSMKNVQTPKTLKTHLKRFLASKAFYSVDEFLNYSWGISNLED